MFRIQGFWSFKLLGLLGGLPKGIVKWAICQLLGCPARSKGLKARYCHGHAYVYITFV